MPLMNFRLAEPSRVIDLNGIEALSFIDMAGATLRIGAMTRTRAVERSETVARALPILSHAAHWIGHVQIRNRGTVGGSIAHGDPAAELPAMCVLLNAEVRVQGPAGARSMQAANFFEGFLSTALGADEIVTDVVFPLSSATARWGFAEFAQRRGDFALCGSGCVIDPEGGTAGVVVFGPADKPVRCAAAEDVIRENGCILSDEVIARAAGAASDHVQSLRASDDPESTHRYGLVEPLVRRALSQAATSQG